MKYTKYILPVSGGLVALILIGIFVYMFSLKNTADELDAKLNAQETKISSLFSDNTNIISNSTGTTTNSIITTGAQGAIGPSGMPGATGIQGEQGIQGLTGPSGVPGKNGTNGTNGVSGYEIVSNFNWTSISANAVGTAYESCPTGKKVISVECYTYSGSNDVRLRGSTVFLNGSGGSCNFYNGGAYSAQVSVMLVCITAN